MAFGCVLLANFLSNQDISGLYFYVICVAVLITGFFVGQEKPIKTLFVFGTLGFIAMLIGILQKDKWFFMPSEWRIILLNNVALYFLHEYCWFRKIHSRIFLLIMMILGGAIIPPIQGKIADLWHIHNSYWVAFVAFILAFLL